MPTLASRPAPVVGAATAGERTLLKRPRGVVAVAPASCGQMAQERFASRVVTRKPTAPTCDVKIRESFAVGKVSVVPAPAPGRLKQRLGAEHAVRAGQDGARILASKRRPEAAKRRTILSSKPATQAAHQCTEPAVKQQPDQPRAAPTPRPMSKLIEKAQEVLKKRRLEELARARDKFRMELLEVEKAAMPDETIYPEDLEELGLTELQYAVTPTRKQAQRRRLG
ncbi:hypothetical protein EJB05_35428, partial [Eragrostis curvula]